jgi:UDP-N-acetylglucosamine--N-acetylmuramyl-(pentapeptide) pyrophosphoryl-undecaprenol N-acetylglucosamine transferase
MAGGGTGGHLFPGIALAEEFVSRDSECRIVFVGSEKRMEARILPKRGFELYTIPAAPLKGVNLRSQVFGLVTFIRGFVASVFLLVKRSPALVVGLGGYSSGPVLVAAYLLRITSVILEQNVVPGFTNRIASHLCRLAFVSWHETIEHFPSAKVRLTGNPLRKEILSGQGRKRSEGTFTLLVLGGSQGATAINRAMVDAVEHLDAIRHNIYVVHQTGEVDSQWVKQAYADKGIQAAVHCFIDDMSGSYRSANLVVCRAGATTLTELCALGRTAIIIPYPYASDDHQRRNARVLVNAGAARMIAERDLTGKRVAREITGLYGNRERLKHMERAASTLARPEAAASVVSHCYQLMGLQQESVSC